MRNTASVRRTTLFQSGAGGRWRTIDPRVARRQRPAMSWHRPRILILLVALAGGMSIAAPAPRPADIPRDFTLSNGVRTTTDRLRGRVVVLNIWATWCVPCRAEVPLLNAYYRGHRDEGLVVIGIAVDRGKTPNDQLVSPAITYLQAGHVHGRDLTVTSVPTSYVFSKTGRLEHVGRRAFDARSLERVLAPLLKAK